MTDEPTKFETVVAWQMGYLTEDALREQDGKEVPLTMEPGGPVIGKATLKYDPEQKALLADFEIDDPKVAELFRGNQPPIF